PSCRAWPLHALPLVISRWTGRRSARQPLQFRRATMLDRELVDAAAHGGGDPAALPVVDGLRLDPQQVRQLGVAFIVPAQSLEQLGIGMPADTTTGRGVLAVRLGGVGHGATEFTP